VIEHANQLTARGHRVSIVVPKSAIDDEMRRAVRAEVSVIEADYPLAGPEDRPPSLWDKLRLTIALVRAVPEGDLLIATHTPTTVVSLVAGALPRRGIRVWFYQDYPEMFRGRPLESWLLRNAMRWHRLALVVSRFSADELTGISKGEVRYVGQILNDYDEFSSQVRDHTVNMEEPRRLIYVGDFRPRKGLVDFLSAARILFEKRFEIELVLVLKERGEIDTPVPYQVVFRPDPGRLAHWFGEGDVFVSSSWHESFGLPPLEAMASGTPVVVTDSGGVRDYARHEENCLIVPPGNAPAIAAAVERILTEPDLVGQLIEKGRLTAAEYTVDRAVDRMEAALREVMDS
jgi:glycosyltransferase involved in cell wall biosynthesis